MAESVGRSSTKRERSRSGERRQMDVGEEVGHKEIRQYALLVKMTYSVLTANVDLCMLCRIMRQSVMELSAFPYHALFSTTRANAHYMPGSSKLQSTTSD